MEPIVLYSKTRTKLRATLWGSLLILFGLFLEAGMMYLCFTEGFSVWYIVAIVLFTLPIWAGLYSLNTMRFPVVLRADEKGIHHFAHANRWGYGMKEIVVAWKEINGPIESPSIPFDKDEYEDEAAIEAEMNAIQFTLEDEAGHREVLIHLNDTDSTLESITALVSTLNDMRVFYSL